MKKLLVMAAATMAATSAFAAVKIEVRSDYVNVGKYTNMANTDIGGYSVFAPSVARLYLTGNVGEAVIDSGWNLRAFTGQWGAATPGGADTTYYKNMTADSFVDHLTIEKSMSGWTFKAGKLWMNVGGFERRNAWHGDTYLTSMANGGVGGQTGTGTFSGGTVVTPGNMSGISAAYNITPDQKVEVQMANATNSQTANGGVASTDRRHSYTAAYMGSFLDKMLQPYLSYTSGAADTATAGHEQTYYAAGLRIAPMENMGVDVEYLSNEDKNSNSTGTNAGTKSTTTSTVAELRYNFNGWIPVAKYEMSTDKANDADNFKRDAFAVALEMVPKADEAFRYHVAYTSIKDHDFPTATTYKDMTQNVITVGLKYTGDFAK